jgi:hypothetical protein
MRPFQIQGHILNFMTYTSHGNRSNFLLLLANIGIFQLYSYPLLEYSNFSLTNLLFCLVYALRSPNLRSTLAYKSRPNFHHNTTIFGLKDVLQRHVHHWQSKVNFTPFHNAKIRLNACCVGDSICQYAVEHSQMLKAPMTRRPQRLGNVDDEVGSTILWLYKHLVIDGNVITENTSNAMYSATFPDRTFASYFRRPWNLILCKCGVLGCHFLGGLLYKHLRTHYICLEMYGKWTYVYKVSTIQEKLQPSLILGRSNIVCYWI